MQINPSQVKQVTAGARRRFSRIAHAAVSWASGATSIEFTFMHID
jgi:hypothetical protein